MDIIAQGFGIIGMICNILVFQQKSQRNVLIWQFFAATVFAINYFMLGAVVGGMLNTVGALRSIVFLFKDSISLNLNFILVLHRSISQY